MGEVANLKLRRMRKMSDFLLDSVLNYKKGIPLPPLFPSSLAPVGILIFIKTEL